MRMLGLDVGERRIGVAVCDEEERLAFPLTVIERRGTARDFAEIDRLLKQERAGLLVVGLPLSLDGSIGPQARLVQEFVQRLAQQADVPVETWDERLSSVEAERHLLAMAESRERRRQRRDAVAAAIILQSYLDSRRTGERQSQNER